MTNSIPPHSNPSRQFLSAPGLMRIAGDLHHMLQPAMTQGRDDDRIFAPRRMGARQGP